MKEQAENEIRKVATGFAGALEFGSPEEIAAFMCAEDREHFLDTVNINFEGSKWEEVEVEVSEIEIRGDRAKARVLGVSDNAKSIDGVLYFSKELGEWKTSDRVEDEWDD